MCTPEWDLVRLVEGGKPRVGARLQDGRTIDLQAAHLAKTGRECPHFRDLVAFRLGGSYVHDLSNELVRWATARGAS